MAFKRQSFSSLRTTKRENFESTYKFSKKVPNFKAGNDVYVIPLGLETGFYETPCHRVMTHKVDGQTIGFGGAGFPVYIKCEGVDVDGNKKDSLCCQLAAKERERCGENIEKRIISGKSNRIHLPILILGNSLTDDSKLSYPISKVAILKDLKSEAGLKFSYLDMSASTFTNDIVKAYGKKLKEDGILDYELDEESEEFFEEVRTRLIKTVIKIHGISKTGFTAPMKEYSFFPFSSAAIASGSGDAERKAIVGYKDNSDIMEKVSEYLQLFDVEVDKLIRSWKEADLQEYYNSALGLDLKATSTAPKKEKIEETVEVVEENETPEESSASEPVSDDELDSILENPFGDEETSTSESDEELDNFEGSLEEDEDFFEE